MITESRQKRVLLIIITILLLANVATLVMFFVADPIPRKSGGDARKEKMKGYLKKELGYNETQLKAYETINQQHKKDVDSVFNSMRREKESRLKEMSAADFSDSSIEKAAVRMAQKHQLLEVKMLKHLKDIRALGDASQRAKFDTGFLPYMNRSRSRNKN
jgi:Spy/CpxP family protein refolding chaperone